MLPCVAKDLNIWDGASKYDFEKQMILPSFEYVKLGDFTYNLLRDPADIRAHLMKWIMREWESDYNLDSNEHWTFSWMNALPKMTFQLEILQLQDIHPNKDLIRVEQFLIELKERADDREESILRGQSIEPLLVNRVGFELMDGYTRYTVLKRYDQKEVYAYVGSI
jgi:hypothetical protein